MRGRAFTRLCADPVGATRGEQEGREGQGMGVEADAEAKGRTQKCDSSFAFVGRSFSSCNRTLAHAAVAPQDSQSVRKVPCRS